MIEGLAAAASRTSRYAGCPAFPASAVLVALALLVIYGLALVIPGATPSGGAPASKGGADLALYQAIAGRVAAGDPYYAAAVGEHRARKFPLRPVVTVRLPTLAFIQAKLGACGAALLLAALTVAAWLALMRRLVASGAGPRVMMAGAALAALGLAPGLVPVCAVWHETWAAVLVTLALALWSPDRWWPSLVCAVAAVAIRELALPVLCVMGVAALLEGRRREAAAWGAGLLAFAGMMVAHARRIGALVRPDDLHSPGWTSFGGWCAVLRMTHDFTALTTVALPLVAVLVPLSLLGWAGWRGDTGWRGACVVGGYLLGFTIFGRADNGYWAVMIAPLLPLGLAFAPVALVDLAAAARRRAGTSNPLRHRGATARRELAG